MGSINVNGMRDGRKSSLLSEIIQLKELSVVFFCKRLIVVKMMRLIGDSGGKEIFFLAMGLFKCWSGCAFFYLILKLKFYPKMKRCQGGYWL